MFRRYAIRRHDGFYWRGQIDGVDTWSPTWWGALLFANLDVVNEEFRALNRRLFNVEGCKVRDFECKVSVRIHSRGADYDLYDVMNYLIEAARITLDFSKSGDGPVADSLTEITVDWSDLTERPSDQSGRQNA
jgi:hypothetical protein